MRHFASQNDWDNDDSKYLASITDASMVTAEDIALHELALQREDERNYQEALRCKSLDRNHSKSVDDESELIQEIDLTSIEEASLFSMDALDLQSEEICARVSSTPQIGTISRSASIARSNSVVIEIDNDSKAEPIEVELTSDDIQLLVSNCKKLQVQERKRRSSSILSQLSTRDIDVSISSRALRCSDLSSMGENDVDDEDIIASPEFDIKIKEAYNSQVEAMFEKFAVSTNPDDYNKLLSGQNFTNMVQDINAEKCFSPEDILTVWSFLREKYINAGNDSSTEDAPIDCMNLSDFHSFLSNTIPVEKEGDSYVLSTVEAMKTELLTAINAMGVENPTLSEEAAPISAILGGKVILQQHASSDSLDYNENSDEPHRLVRLSSGFWATVVELQQSDTFDEDWRKEKAISIDVNEDISTEEDQAEKKASKFANLSLDIEQVKAEDPQASGTIEGKEQGEDGGDHTRSISKMGPRGSVALKRTRSEWAIAYEEHSGTSIRSQAVDHLKESHDLLALFYTSDPYFGRPQRFALLLSLILGQMFVEAFLYDLNYGQYKGDSGHELLLKGEIEEFAQDFAEGILFGIISSFIISPVMIIVSYGFRLVADGLRNSKAYEVIGGKQKMHVQFKSGTAKNGILRKQGALHKNWKRRQFHLESFSLTYAAIDSGLKKGELLLSRTCQVRANHSAEFENCFELVHPKRTLLMCAESPEEQHSWITSIQSHIDASPKSLVDAIEMERIAEGRLRLTEIRLARAERAGFTSAIEKLLKILHLCQNIVKTSKMHTKAIRNRHFANYLAEEKKAGHLHNTLQNEFFEHEDFVDLDDVQDVKDEEEKTSFCCCWRNPCTIAWRWYKYLTFEKNLDEHLEKQRREKVLLELPEEVRTRKLARRHLVKQMSFHKKYLYSRFLTSPKDEGIDICEPVPQWYLPALWTLMVLYLLFLGYFIVMFGFFHGPKVTNAWLLSVGLGLTCWLFFFRPVNIVLFNAVMPVLIGQFLKEDLAFADNAGEAAMAAAMAAGAAAYAGASPRGKAKSPLHRMFSGRSSTPRRRKDSLLENAGKEGEGEYEMTFINDKQDKLTGKPVPFKRQNSTRDKVAAAAAGMTGLAAGIMKRAVDGDL